MRAFAIAALLSILTHGLGAQAQHVGSDSAATARYLEDQQHEIAQAIVRGEWRVLDSLYAPEYVFIDGSGTRWNRSAVFQQGTAGAVRTEALRYKDLSVRLYGSAAIVTGIATVALHYESGSYGGDSRFTRVHIRRGDRWLVALYHVTRIAPPEMPTRVSKPQQPNEE